MNESPPPDSWTPRQREVLDLLAKRRSNGEIAAELGITVDGVKWHVREILSTLGVASREDAAEYWRHANGLPSRLRRLVVPPAAVGLSLKLGAGAFAVAGLVAVAAVVAIALRGDSSLSGERNSATARERAPASADQFYLEARIEHANIASFDQPRETYRPTVIDLRWWWSEPAAWRYEQTFYERTGEVVEALDLADGTDRWAYTEGHEQYSRQRIDHPILGFVDTYAGPRGHLGPSIETSLDSLVEAWRRRHEIDREVRIVGEEEVLGRRTIVIEYEPVLDASHSNGRLEEAGVGRLWVDPDTLFVLRHVQEIPGWGELLRAEVTELRYDETPPAHLLTFQPPTGTTEAPTPMPLRRPDPPDWMLDVNYIPDGYLGGSFEMSGPRDWVESVYLVSYEARDTNFIRVRQSISEPELPEAEPHGRWIDAGSREVYVVEQANETRVGWREGGIAITITADTLSLDELLRIAVSVE